MKPGRICCCIPFCGRTASTTGKFAGCVEIICGKHWRLARCGRRRTYGRLLREIDRDPRAFWEMPPGSPERLRRIKVMRVADKLWELIKAEAIGAAGGIC